jgi:hypothetical protein
LKAFTSSSVTTPLADSSKHDVAVPVSKFKLVDGKLVLPGATKEALKASPEFEYAK